MFARTSRVIFSLLPKSTTNTNNFNRSIGSRSSHQMLARIRGWIRRPTFLASGLIGMSFAAGYGLSIMARGKSRFGLEKNRIEQGQISSVNCSPMDGIIVAPPPQPPPYQPPVLPLKNHGVESGPPVRFSINDTTQQRRMKHNQMVGQRQHDFIFTNTIQAVDPQNLLVNGRFYLYETAKNRTWEQWRDNFGNLLGRDRYGQNNFTEVHVVLWDCENDMPDLELWDNASIENPALKWCPNKLIVVSAFWDQGLGEYRFHIYSAFVLFEFERVLDTYSRPNLMFDHDRWEDFTTPSRIVSINTYKKPLYAPPGDFELEAIVNNFDNIMRKWNRDTTFIR